MLRAFSKAAARVPRATGLLSAVPSFTATQRVPAVFIAPQCVFSMQTAQALPATPDLTPLTVPLTAASKPASASASASASDSSSEEASSKTKDDSKSESKSNEGAGAGAGASESESKTRPRAVLIGDIIIGTFLGFVASEAYSWVTHYPAPNPQVVEAARRTDFAQEHVGADLDRVFYRPWTGTVNRHSAKVRIPVKGSKGSGVLHAQALYLPSTQEWEIISLQLAVPELADRLTDIMPPSPLDNMMPYMPSPNDPSALVWPPVNADAAAAAATAAAAAAAPAAATAAPVADK